MSSVIILYFTYFCRNFSFETPHPLIPKKTLHHQLFCLARPYFLSRSLSLYFFGLWYFFQCVKTSRAYMETAALCKYLWCNISMWIDFPLSPSITAATLWKGSPRPCAQAAGRAHGSAASPCAQSICFFFLLTETLRTGRAFVTVSSLAFLEPPKKTSKRIVAFLSAWCGRRPAECCDRKMRCRSNGEKWNRRPLLSSHAN